MTTAMPPRPFYTIEALVGTEWKIVDTRILRGAAIDLSKDLAKENDMNHFVYVQTRSMQRKHVFTARKTIDA